MPGSIERVPTGYEFVDPSLRRSNSVPNFITAPKFRREVLKINDSGYVSHDESPNPSRVLAGENFENNITNPDFASKFDEGKQNIKSDKEKTIFDSRFIDMQSYLNNNDSGRNYEHPGLQGLKFGNAEIVFNRPSTGVKNALDIMRKAIASSLFNSGWSSGELNSATLTHMIDGSSGVSFCEMQGPEGVLYVHPRMLTIKRLDDGNGKKSKSIRLSREMINLERQDAVSGVCLFGASSVIVKTENGSKYHPLNQGEMEKAIEDSHPITEIIENKALHPYEEEIVSRLTGFLKSINAKELNLSFYVPRLEYWLYGFHLYERGLMGKELLEQWFSMVDIRSERMKALISENLPENAKGTTAFTDSLSGIEDILKEELQEDKEEGEHPLKRIVDRLSTDKIWENILDRSHKLALEEEKNAQNKGLTVKRPKFKLKDKLNALDLNRLSGVVTYAKKLDATRDNGLLLVVECPMEVAILEQSRQLIKIDDEQADAKAILGLYPHPNLIVPEGKAFEGKNYLFYYNNQEDNLSDDNHSTDI